MEDLSFRRFETNPIYDDIDYTHEQLLSRDTVIPSFTQCDLFNNNIKNSYFSFNVIRMNIGGSDFILGLNDDVLDMNSSSILNDIKMVDLMKRYYTHCERCGISMCLESIKDDGTQYTLCDECFRLLNDRNSIIGDKDTYIFDTVLDVI